MSVFKIDITYVTLHDLKAFKRNKTHMCHLRAMTLGDN